MLKYSLLLSVTAVLVSIQLAFAEGVVACKNVQPQPFGINLAGAEFGSIPGEFGKHYTYPTEANLDYLLEKGFILVRLPFKWERMQHQLSQELDSEEIKRLVHFMKAVEEREMKVIFDLHNYARRKVGNESFVIGSEKVTVADLADFWKRLAIEMKPFSKSIYGYALMNEPYDLKSPSEWFKMAQASIYSIREVDHETTIIVGGNDWSSAERWMSQSDTLKYIYDPGNNLIFEAHVYFDNDASGAYRGSYEEENASSYKGIERIQPFVNWLKVNGFRGFVGEYGVPADDERWLVTMDNFLSYLQQNNINATYWAGGPWWGNYKLSIMPDKNGDKLQMKIVEKYLYTSPGGTQK